MLDRLQKIFGTAPTLSSIMKRHESDTEYTPDWPEQMKKMWVPIFAYTPKIESLSVRDYLIDNNIKLLQTEQGKRPLYVGYTDQEFYHWQKDLGLESFSVVLEDQISGHSFEKQWMKPQRIWGEVFAVRPNTLLRLDFMHENGLQYFRKKVSIIVPNTKVLYSRNAPVPNVTTPRIQTLDCYIYFGNHLYWDQQLGGILPSSPVPVFDHLKDEIGQFTRFKK